MDDFMDSDSEFELKSKSQLKRESHQIVQLGARIVSLPRNLRDTLPLTDALRKAIEEAASIRAHGAVKRQLKYIGKLLREMDCTPITEALQRLDAQHDHQTAHHHQLERLRERFIENDKDAFTELKAKYQHTDIQQLRALIKAAQKEREHGSPAGAGRKLFRFLRDLEDQT